MTTSTQCKLCETARVRSTTQMGHYSILSFASSVYDCTPFMGYVILMQTYSTGTYRVWKSNDTSTGNLRKHIAFCVLQLNESKIMEKFATGCTYSCEGFHWLVMCWVALLCLVTLAHYLLTKPKQECSCLWHGSTT